MIGRRSRAGRPVSSVSATARATLPSTTSRSSVTGDTTCARSARCPSATTSTSSRPAPRRYACSCSALSAWRPSCTVTSACRRGVTRLPHQFLVTFFGGGGGATTLHYDVDLPHVFHVVVHGRKEFYLFAASETPHLHRHPWTVRRLGECARARPGPPPQASPAPPGGVCWWRRARRWSSPPATGIRSFTPAWARGLSFRKYDVRRAPAGLYNLVVQETVDRLLARVAPGRWEAWKEQRSQRAPRRPGAMLQRP